jgi:hypothetical protein
MDDASFTDPRIELIIKGAKRLYGEGKKRLRLPITEDILSRIIGYFPDDFDGLNLKAALCTGFAAFLRSGEFTWNSWDHTSSQRHLARKHFQFETDGSVVLTLPASKTDPFASGVDIYLAVSPPSVICPATALRRLFSRFPAQPDLPAFSRTVGAFSKVYLIEKIKEALLRAGISTRGYSGHSLRKGAAVSAAAKGISRDDIKRLGRWKSDAVDLYINDLPQATLASNLLSLNARLLATPRSASLGPSNPMSTL